MVPIWQRNFKNPIKNAHSLPDSPINSKNGNAMRYKFSPPIVNKKKFLFNENLTNNSKNASNNIEQYQQFSPFV